MQSNAHCQVLPGSSHPVPFALDLVHGRWPELLANLPRRGILFPHIKEASLQIEVVSAEAS
jgi:hypothetical protein